MAGAAVAASICVRAAPAMEDSFASSSTRECGSAYMACTAANHLAETTNARYRVAGEKCSGPLNAALAYEDELNAALPALATKAGKARDAYYDDTVNPLIHQRGDAMDNYRACTKDAMSDPRPADYPKSDLLLSTGISNDVSNADRIAAELQEMVADAADNVLYGGDRFMTGVLDWASETATFLAQEPGKPMEQIVQGTGTLLFETVPAYLTNNNADNHKQLYEAAAKSVGDFQRDPAYHLGHAAPNMIPVGALTRAKALAGLQKTSSALKRLSRRKSLPGGLEPEVRNQIAKRPIPPRNPPRGGDYGAGPPPGTDGYPLDRPPSSGASTAGAPRPTGPDMSDVPPPPSSLMESIPANPYPGCPNCFYAQVVNDLRDYYKQPFSAPATNAGTVSNQWALLREVYGKGNAKNPYHGTGGLQRHAAGLPVKSSKQNIERALATAAERERFVDMHGNPIEANPRGMVIVEWRDGGAHAFDAKWNPRAGRVEFTDPAEFGAIADGYFGDASSVWFFRQR
jgi:hypothetical protein